MDDERKHGWPIPGRCFWSYTVLCRQANYFWARQNSTWLPYHYGGRTSLKLHRLWLSSTAACDRNITEVLASRIRMSICPHMVL